MDPRVLLSVLIFAGFGMFVKVTNPTAVSNDILFDIEKLYQDCHISNSVTVTECLRRVRKQAHLNETDSDCLERCVAECVKEKRDCAERCKHCLRRTERYKHRLINITEPDDGKRNNPAIVNVTNHIHVHNHYNTCSTLTGISPYKINVNQQNCPCYFMTWFPCYCRPRSPIYQYPYQWPYISNGGYTGNVCVCPDEAIQCDECNPPVG